MQQVDFSSFKKSTLQTNMFNRDSMFTFKRPQF